MSRWLRRLVCKLRGHQPGYTVDERGFVHLRCKFCNRSMLLDPRGSLFE